MALDGAGAAGHLRAEVPAARAEEAHDEIVVHAFVMVPATEVKNGLLNGYRIGDTRRRR